MNERCCANCANAVKPMGRWYRLVLHGWGGLITCISHPDAPGQIMGMPAHRVCPNFRPKPKPPLRLPAPEPPDADSRLIPLTQGKFAIVDVADYEWLSKYKWHVVRPGKEYAGRKQGGKTIYMHREIMQTPPGKMVDHKNGIGYDNRRRNMRNCTNQQNMQNIRKSPGASSDYKGVHYDERRGTYSAKICHNRDSRHLGTFTIEIEAARAYDRAAVELFGEFAHPNFPEEWPPDRRRDVHEKYQATAPKQTKPPPKAKRKQAPRRPPPPNGDKR